MNRPLAAALWGTLALAGCERTIGTGGGEQAEAETGADGGCPDGETLCDDKCKDLNVDKQNCGECGHSCPFSDYCDEGSCTPDWTPCFQPTDELATCAEVCDTIPEATCSENGCHVAYTAIIYLEGPECTGTEKDYKVGCDAALPIGAYVECCCEFD